MLELDAIKARCDAKDVPALVAEVEKLNKGCEELSYKNGFIKGASNACAHIQANELHHCKKAVKELKARWANECRAKVKAISEVEMLRQRLMDQVVLFAEVEKWRGLADRAATYVEELSWELGRSSHEQAGKWLADYEAAKEGT